MTYNKPAMLTKPTKSLASGILALTIGLGIVLFAIVMISLIFTTEPSVKSGVSEDQVRRLGPAIFLGFLGAMGLWGVVSGIVELFDASHYTEAVTEYHVKVDEFDNFLKTEYGLTLDRSAVELLLAHDTTETDISGVPTLLEMVYSADDKNGKLYQVRTVKDEYVRIVKQDATASKKDQSTILPTDMFGN